MPKLCLGSQIYKMGYIPYLTSNLSCVAKLKSGCNLRQIKRTLRCRKAFHKKPYCCTVTVQSNDSDNSLSEVPEHPKALKLLYVAYSLASYVERVWRFGYVLVLSSLFGGFEVIAIIGFSSQLAAVVIGPTVGQWLDNNHRGFALNAIYLCQTLSIGLSVAMLLIAIHKNFDVSAIPVFVAGFTILQMIERLCALAYDVSVERDWIVQLVGLSRAQAMAAANAWLRRYDLATELFGTFIFGWSISQFNATYTLTAYITCAIICVAAQLIMVARIIRLAPQAILYDRASRPKEKDDTVVLATIQQKFDVSEIFVMARKRLLDATSGWRVYFKQAILIPNVAFIFLYFNMALQPSGLLTAYLTQHGLTPEGAALFRGSCALSGVVGTWMVQILLKLFGLVKSGALSIIMLSSSLSIAAILFYFTLDKSPTTLSLVAFAICIAVSRCALWSFDIINAQFFQMAVKRSEVASVSSTEYAMCAMAELCMLGLAVMWRKPAQYGILVAGSLGAVLFALVLYVAWILLWDGQKRVESAIQENIQQSCA